MERKAVSAPEALWAARAAGVAVRIEGNDLALEADSQPPAEILERLARHKPGIVALLRPGRDGWSAEDWQPGRPQRYLDKQFVRDWSSTITDWDRTPPGPPIPADIVEATRDRYIEVYERITQNRWQED